MCDVDFGINIIICIKKKERTYLIYTLYLILQILTALTPTCGFFQTQQPTSLEGSTLSLTRTQAPIPPHCWGDIQQIYTNMCFLDQFDQK